VFTATDMTRDMTGVRALVDHLEGAMAGIYTPAEP
jgi:hypothetical protein